MFLMFFFDGGCHWIVPVDEDNLTDTTGSTAGFECFPGTFSMSGGAEEATGANAPCNPLAVNVLSPSIILSRESHIMNRTTTKRYELL